MILAILGQGHQQTQI